MTERSSNTFSPLLSAILACVLWGSFPLYWKQLAAVPSSEILAHRIIWSLVFLSSVLWYQGRLLTLSVMLQSRAALVSHVMASILIGTNWLLYIWAVSNGHIVDTSLGFFLNPVLSMLIGIIAFAEPLSKRRSVALGLAVFSVALTVFDTGRLPLISLSVAGTFCLYSVLQRKGRGGVVESLTLETSFLLIPACAFLMTLESNGTAAVESLPTIKLTLVLLSGVVTSIPLLLFNYGAQKLPFTTLGILQYISPSIQLALGCLVYHETLSTMRAFSFLTIWIAIGLYLSDPQRGPVPLVKEPEGTR